MSSRVMITVAVAAVALSAPVALAAPYSFQTIAVPASGVVNGINNGGQVVGTVGTQAFSEILSTGAVTIYPQAGFSTTGQAINDNGQIAGSYVVSGSDVQYIRNTVTGAVTDYRNFPGFIQSSNAAGINDAGIITGYFTGSYHSTTADRSYLFDPATGVLTPLVDPATGPSNGYLLSDPLLLGYTHAADVNNAGTVVGTSLLLTAANTLAPAGFIYDPASGTFTHLSVPGSSATAALGLNDSGQIVGTYTVDARPQAFVYDEATGQYTTLESPDGTVTAAVGINDSGQIVGQYTDANGVTQNFLASPAAPSTVPEPPAMALLATVTGLLGLIRRRRARLTAPEF